MLKIFQVEKNNNDIRKIILTNIVKMLTERKMLKEENIEININKLINIKNEDHVYILELDNLNNKKIMIKLFNQKISSISKQSPISDFLNKFRDIDKIIIVKNINTKSSQHILNNYPKTEIFTENQLMINLIDNIFVPRYENLDHDSDDFKNLCNLYNCKKRNIPKIYKTDPMAKYYNLKKGDIVRIIRSSENSGSSPFYRLVI